MTTTAEKIRDIQIEMKRAENKLKEAIDVINALHLAGQIRKELELYESISD